MHVTNILLPLLTASVVIANSLEERAAPSCSISSIHDIITSIYRPSGVVFCNAYLHAPTSTITTQTTQTITGKKTVTQQTTITSTAVKTATVSVTVKAKASSTTTSASKSTNAATINQRQLERRSTSLFTPTALRTLGPQMRSSVCSCLTTTPTITVTSTSTVSGAGAGTTTVYSTSTVVRTTTTTVSQTVTASPIPFYLHVPTSSNLTIAGQYGSVTGETMSFVTTTTSATQFTIDANGHLISGSNGWIANMQEGASHSTLFFDSAALIASQGNLVQATCDGSTGSLVCQDQSANTLYYCSYVGADIVIAPQDYDGAGCVPVVLNTITAA